MRNILLIITLSFIPYLMKAQENGSIDSGWGIELNSKFNSQASPVIILPSIFYYKGKNQIEIGVGGQPFSLEEERSLGGELNYKYFPNGRENKFNMYFTMSFAYLNQLRKTYYPATYQYLFLNGGYGFQITAFKGIYLGTNINLGIYTYSKQSENPYFETLGTIGLFSTFHANASCEVKVGYCF